jgi:acyl-CoA thioesterase-2
MWFHRPPRPGDIDGWLLYLQEAGAAGAGRGLGTGRFFTPDRHHLATVAQEGMIRTA